MTRHVDGRKMRKSCNQIGESRFRKSGSFPRFERCKYATEACRADSRSAFVKNGMVSSLAGQRFEFDI